MQNRINTIKQAVLNVQSKQQKELKELAKLARMVIESETVKTTEKPDNSFSELNFN